MESVEVKFVYKYKEEIFLPVLHFKLKNNAQNLCLALFVIFAKQKHSGENS